MRAGQMIATTTPQGDGPKGLAELMVGKSLSMSIDRSARIAEDRPQSRGGLCARRRGTAFAVDHVSFSLRAGEVLGVAGIEGNGQTQLAQALLGLLPLKSGQFLFDGAALSDNRPVRFERPAWEAYRMTGRAWVWCCNTPFRTTSCSIVSQKSRLQRVLFGWIKKAASRCAEELLESFDVRAAGINVPVGTLSGGNQQKVVVGRELSIPLKLLIAAQPTRGVDIASAASIQNKIMDAAEHGTGVLLISSDLDELIHTSDRIMVMSRGKIVDILEAKNATKERLGQLMLGVSQET